MPLWTGLGRRNSCRVGGGANLKDCPIKFKTFIFTLGLLVKNYGRLCRKKSKRPNHWIFSKELLRPYLSNTAVNCAKVIL